MTDLDFMKILWSASTISCSIMVIGMLSYFKRLSVALDILTTCMHEMIINKGIVEYETGIPSMAEDTKVHEDEKS